MKIVSTHDRTEVLNHNMSLSTTFQNCPCLLNVLGRVPEPSSLAN